MPCPRTTAAVLLLLVGLGCGLPRDADGTLDRVRGGTIRVGVVANPPWVVLSASGVSGVEGALVMELARQLGARPAWVQKPAAELREALKNRELDLVIGGLTDAEPWKNEVAFTKPFYTDTVVVGLPPGAPPMRDLEGQTVAVEAGDAVAHDLKQKDATPAVVASLAQASGAVAAPSWRLSALGRESSGIVLHEAKHVMAVPPGENAWLIRIERHLRDRKPTMPQALRAASTRL